MLDCLLANPFGVERVKRPWAPRAFTALGVFRFRTSSFLLRLSSKLPVEKLRSCFVGANPAPAAEEIVDFVGKHQFFKIDVLCV